MYGIAEIKAMNNEQLAEAARNIREELLRATSANGGHLASNLGTVELTLALHCVFDSPKDRLVFDVGHQTYTHKLLTGRSLDHLRSENGTGGFPDPDESEHDPFVVGHSATAVSTALGLARARDIKGEHFHIVAVVGDGAFGGGMNLEAINDLGYNKTPLIIVLNDNEMSISRNVGAISRHLVKLRTARGYAGLKRGLERFLKGIPLVGGYLFRAALSIKNLFRYILIGNTVFDNMGIKYIGSVDGHNIRELKNILRRAKEETVPVIVHVRTKKGKGSAEAEQNPAAFHGVAPSGAPKSSKQDFTSCFGSELTELARRDKRVCAVTAGMMGSTGLSGFAASFPERFFDVGIAEQHALGLSAGLAKGGMRPFAAIYSTFLQRGADQIFHDIMLNRLPVTLCVDRAGFVGQDGRTHQGAYDIAILRQYGITVMAPAGNSQLRDMLELALTLPGPCAIRYPKGCGMDADIGHTELFRWQTVRHGADAVIIAFGALLGQAVGAAELLEERGVSTCVINACFISPIDTELLRSLTAPVVCVAEDNAAPGGLGEAVSAIIDASRLLCISGEKGFALHAPVSAQQKACGLDAQGMANRIFARLRGADNGLAGRKTHGNDQN